MSLSSLPSNVEDGEEDILLFKADSVVCQDQSFGGETLSSRAKRLGDKAIEISRDSDQHESVFISENSEAEHEMMRIAKIKW